MSSLQHGTDSGNVKSFYGSHVDVQWSRFDQMARVEEYVLRRILHEHLPSAPSVIGDIGGGNGRHAFYLADKGYQVRLCDLTPELIADADRRNRAASSPLSSIEVADAASLAWSDESIDAGLLLGPMYCLHDHISRAAVLRETWRVLKPGAPLFVQFFSRVAALRSLLEAAPQAAGIFSWEEFLKSGTFTDTHIPDFLRVHYFTTPREALREMADIGFGDLEIRGMDGPAPSFGQRNLAGAPSQIVAQWGEIAYALGAISEYQSTSTHLLVVAVKPTDGRSVR